MLVSFRVANHRSIRDEQQLLLTPQYADSRPATAARQMPATPVAGIFGPNAAGKSNVLDALRYMRDMVVRSHLKAEPGAGVERFPFRLDPTIRDEPSHYAVDLVLDRVRHTYGFAVDGERVVEEWLYTYPFHRKRTVFERTDEELRYGEHTSATMRQVQEITEPNVLFLSMAARSRQDPVRPVYLWFRYRLRFFLPQREWLSPTVVGWLDDERLREQMNALLRAADTGIESVELVEPDLEQTSLLGPGLASPPRRAPGTPPPRQPSLFGPEFDRSPAERRKRLRQLSRDVRELVFTHHGAKEEVRLALGDQSAGTQALLNLGASSLVTLGQGGVLAVDELDASLHPYLSAEIIRLFRGPDTNPKGAQLIFTSHDASLLGRIHGEEVLARDHIWFVEKDESGATELFPLTDFKPRKEENRERRYLAGRYGAVPLVDDELIAAALASRSEGSV